VTPVDYAALALVALTAFTGFRRGLAVGALSLAGLVVGAVVGARLGPQLFGDGSRWLPLAALGGGVVGAALGQSVGVMLGQRVRALLWLPPLRVLDRLGGFVLGTVTGLVVCWAVGVALLYTPGQAELRRYAQDSIVLSTLTDGFPPDRLIDELSRIDPFSALTGPGADVPPPDRSVARSSAARAAAGSVVRITGVACGLGVEGSGWIAAPGLVVTNAHVVAGIRSPAVDRHNGKPRRASVVHFDATNDLALLRVPGLAGVALGVGTAVAGRPAALLGYPENGALTSTPVRVGKTVKIVGRDAYGRFPTSRTVTTVRGAIRSGNSGGPIVDAGGNVVATAFARRAGAEGGFGVPSEVVVKALASARTAPVRTTCVKR
jgi:S1-C subfamily serine protease